MRLKSVGFVGLVGILCGFGAGYWLGHRSGATRPTAEGGGVAEARAATPAETVDGKARAKDRDAEDRSRLVPSPRGFESLDTQQILASTGPLDRYQALLAYTQRLSRDQIAPALKDLQQQMRAQVDVDSLIAWHLLMTRFGMEDAEGAMKYLKTADSWGQAFSTGTVLAAMATKDPKAAAAHFQDEENFLLQSPQNGAGIAGAVAKEWAKRDPAAALAWAQSLGPGLKGGAMAAIIGNLSVEDPAKAAQTASGLDLGDGDDRTRIYGQIGQAWAARDPVAAFEWIGGLPAGAQRNEATRRAVDTYAASDPEAAARLVDQMAGEDGHDRLVGAVVGPWVRRDPVAAATWVSAQAEGSGRQEAVRNLMSTWTNTNPTAASTWLAAQPAGSSKDEGIVALSNTVLVSDPEGAATWAATINDPGKRGFQLKGMLDAWLRKDEAAARRWIEATDSLADDERARFLPPK